MSFLAKLDPKRRIRLFSILGIPLAQSILLVGTILGAGTFFRGPGPGNPGQDSQEFARTRNVRTGFSRNSQVQECKDRDIADFLRTRNVGT